MIINGVHFPMQALRELCDQAHVAKLSLFGSILHGSGSGANRPFTAASDIDLLVEFAPDRTPSLLAFAQLQMQLSALLKREVHLSTPAMLADAFRDDVLRGARMLHAA